MPFLKEDLQSTHYHWSNGGNTLTYTGEPSRRLFDRDNGNQVLFIINSNSSSTNKFTTSDGNLIENLLINELPMNAKSEISVFNWVKELMAMKENELIN
jgi:hypothetical protein